MFGLAGKRKRFLGRENLLLVWSLWEDERDACFLGP